MLMEDIEESIKRSTDNFIIPFHSNYSVHNMKWIEENGMKHSQQRGMVVRIKRCTVRKECFEGALIPRGTASRSCELF